MAVPLSTYINEAYKRIYINKESFVNQKLFEIFTYDTFVESLDNVTNLQEIINIKPQMLIQYSSHDVVCPRFINIFKIIDISNHTNFIRLHRNDGGACITEQNKHEYKLHENILIHYTSSKY
jgi:hypothetical protein